MVFTLASVDKGAHIDKTTTYFFVEFLVVRVPTSSPTAADTHNSSEQIGQNWANAALLHIVNFVQAPELHRLCSLARAPSHQGLLQPCCTLAVQCPMLPACLNAAPMRRKLELQLFLSSLTTYIWGWRGAEFLSGVPTLGSIHWSTTSGSSPGRLASYHSGLAFIFLHRGILTSSAEQHNKITQCC